MATDADSPMDATTTLPAHIRAFATVTAMSGLRPSHRDGARRRGAPRRPGQRSADVIAQLMRVLETHASA